MEESIFEFTFIFGLPIFHQHNQYDGKHSSIHTHNLYCLCDNDPGLFNFRSKYCQQEEQKGFNGVHCTIGCMVAFDCSTDP